MLLHKIDLNLFVIFDTIYREKNITRAASQLNLTQPAVSNALRRLRESFDDALFVRTSNGMSPTPVADGAIGDIRKALELMRNTVGAQDRFNPVKSQTTFHLGMNDLAEALLLPKLHESIRRDAPNVSVTSYYVARENAAQELKAGKIDLLLDAPVNNARGLCLEPLKQLPYVLAMRRGHPLAKEEVCLKKYLAAEHLHVSSRRQGRGQVDIALNRMGKRRQISVRIQNYLVAAKIAQETDLLWTTPEILASSLNLHTTGLPFEVDPLVWNLYWARNTEQDPANSWMRAKLASAVFDQ